VSEWTIVDGEGGDGAAFMQSTVSLYGGALTPQQCIDYLVVNLGFAAVRQLHGNLHIKFRPHALTEATFYQLAHALLNSSWQRAMASMHVENTLRDWRDEILPWKRMDAIDRIVQIVREQQLRLSEKVLRRARPLQAIPMGSPMHWAFHVWHHHPHLTRSENLERVLAAALRGRYAWFDAFGPRREVVMTEVGTGFPAAVQAALEACMGARLQDQPDNPFGQYCAEAYGDAAGSGKPLLEDVDAMVTPPNGKPLRRRYSRLILPFRVSERHTRLLSVSFENLAIDLRRGTG
jgi:hypothetical protein